MNFSYLNLLIIHSLLERNDGASIIINQKVAAIIDYLKMELGVFFLVMYSSPLFNTLVDASSSGKSDRYKEMAQTFNGEVTSELGEYFEKIAIVWVI